MRWVLVFLFIFFTPSTLSADELPTEDPAHPVCVIKTNIGSILVELFPEEAPETVKNFIELAEGQREVSDSDGKKKIKRPFYDGLLFHRVIKNLLIQGGCPKGNGTGGPGYLFEDEINADALGLDKIRAIKEGRPHPYLQIRKKQDFNKKVLLPLFKKMNISTNEEVRAREKEINKVLAGMTLKEVYENMGYRYNNQLKSRHVMKGLIAMANSGPNTNGSQFFITLADMPWLDGKHTVFGRLIKGFEVAREIGNVKVGKGKRPVEDVVIISVRLLKGQIAGPGKNFRNTGSSHVIINNG